MSEKQIQISSKLPPELYEWWKKQPNKAKALRFAIEETYFKNKNKRPIIDVSNDLAEVAQEMIRLKLSVSEDMINIKKKLLRLAQELDAALKR